MAVLTPGRVLLPENQACQKKIPDPQPTLSTSPMLMNSGTCRAEAQVKDIDSDDSVDVPQQQTMWTAKGKRTGMGGIRKQQSRLC